jgi:hypothetical protein
MGRGLGVAGLRVLTPRRDFPRSFLCFADSFFDFFAGIVILLSIELIELHIER